MTEHDFSRRVGYLAGSDDQSGLVSDFNQPIANSGSTDVYRLHDQTIEAVRLHVPRNYMRQGVKHRLERFGTLINLVTDADRNPKVLDTIAAMLKGYKGRVLNRPDAVLRSTRERTARTAAGIEGLVVPPVARFVGKLMAAEATIDRAGVAFPAILRTAGTHNGRSVRLIARREDLAAELRPDTSHVLTQFVESRRDDGLYRKVRVFFFGDRPVLRHLLASEHWNVHAADRMRVMADRPDLIAEEEAAIGCGFDGLPTLARAGLRGLREKMGLDFFGVDFAITSDGRALLFEANATMNFLPLSPDPRFHYLAATRERASAAFDRLLGLPL